MSSFEVCGHELKSHMVCVIFCSHVHFVGGEQVERQIKLIMFTHHVYEEGRRKGSEELPRNGYDGLWMLSWVRRRREGVIVCLGGHNKIPQTGQHSQTCIFLDAGGWKSKI